VSKRRLVDTNLIVRYLELDHEKHAKAARKLFVKGFQHKNALRQNNWQHNKHQVTAAQASSTRGRISHRFSADSFPTRVSKLIVRRFACAPWIAIEEQRSISWTV
jgi:hypothetical protein